MIFCQIVESGAIDVLSSCALTVANTSTELLSPNSIPKLSIPLILAGQSAKPNDSKEGDDRNSSPGPEVFNLGEMKTESLTIFLFVSSSVIIPLGSNVHVTNVLDKDNLYLHSYPYANAPQYSSQSCNDIISSKLGGPDLANSRSTVSSTLLLKKATSTSTVIVARPHTLFVASRYFIPR